MFVYVSVYNVIFCIYILLAAIVKSLESEKHPGWITLRRLTYSTSAFNKQEITRLRKMAREAKVDTQEIPNDGSAATGTDIPTNVRTPRFNIPETVIESAISPSEEVEGKSLPVVGL